LHGNHHCRLRAREAGAEESGLKSGCLTLGGGNTRECKLVSALTAVVPFPALAPLRFLSTLFFT
jgi:hypothetical protein